jgi:hypothetical protein
VHIVGSIGCLIIAGILASVVFGDRDPLPGWVETLAIVTMGIMLVCAVRIYLRGVQRKRVTEGPRTKIVLTDVPPPPRRHRKDN